MSHFCKICCYDIYILFICINYLKSCLKITYFIVIGNFLVQISKAKNYCVLTMCKTMFYAFCIY